MMKKIFTLSLAVLLTVSLFAQDKTSSVSTEKNVIKVNTLSLFLGTGSIFYEHGFTDKVSGQLGVGYLNYGTSGNRFSGLFLTPELRFYPKSNAIDGMYVAPYLRYQNLGVTVDPYKATLTNFGGGLAFGRQWITNSGFTMDLFFGGHYSSANLNVKNGSASDFKISAFDGFGVRIGFAIGFGF
jgi:hypothetical protein